jgi:hypothetical protein
VHAAMSALGQKRTHAMQQKWICYSITLVGSRNWNTAPLGSLGKARSSPPCDSMMVRLTASPIPMPSGLVV